MKVENAVWFITFSFLSRHSEKKVRQKDAAMLIKIISPEFLIKLTVFSSGIINSKQIIETEYETNKLKFFRESFGSIFSIGVAISPKISKISEIIL